MRRPGSGFTVLELMIAIAIIAIIAAIAIPSLSHARMSANEASAISDLRTLVTAQTMHRLRYGDYAQPLGLLQARGFVDGFGASGVFSRSGYRYFYLPALSPWEIRAVPIERGRTGERFFTASEAGTIHWSSTGPATVADPVID